MKIDNYRTKIYDLIFLLFIKNLTRGSLRVRIISALNEFGIAVGSSLDRISVKYSIYFVANLRVFIFDNFVSD